MRPDITHLVHEFDPGGRAHWFKPRCKICKMFEEDAIHEVKTYTQEGLPEEDDYV